MLELREIIRLIEQTSIHELKLRNRGVKITLKKSAPILHMNVEPSPEVAPVETKEVAVALEETQAEIVIARGKVKETPLQTIVSPVVGIFSFLVKPGTEAFTQIGDTVTADTVVCSCHVHALNIFHEIKSGVNGVLVEALVEEGEVIEYGQPLFLVKPE